MEAVRSDLAALVHAGAVQQRLVAAYVAHDADASATAPCASSSPSSAACPGRPSRRRCSRRSAWRARRCRALSLATPSIPTLTAGVLAAMQAQLEAGEADAARHHRPRPFRATLPRARLRDGELRLSQGSRTWTTTASPTWSRPPSPGAAIRMPDDDGDGRRGPPATGEDYTDRRIRRRQARDTRRLSHRRQLVARHHQSVPRSSAATARASTPSSSASASAATSR